MSHPLRPDERTADEESGRKLERLAHGIRTPLHAVLGSAELLHDDLSDPSHLAHLATIIQAAETALTCLDRALKDLRGAPVTAPNQGHVELHRKPNILDRAQGAHTATSDRKRRVLVVDDSRVSCLLTQEMLERSGYSVKTAADGKEAVNLFRSREFDLVLLDLEMPIMDGFEAYAHMRDQDAERGTMTPIVALTAESSEAVFQRASHDGFNAFLLKPLARSELLQTVQQYIEKGSK